MTDSPDTPNPASSGFTPPPIPGGAPSVPPVEPAYGQQFSHQDQPYGGSAGAPQPGYGASQQAWTPPPKPGLVPLRPLGFGTLLGAPFQVLRRNPKATLGSALLIQVVITVLTLGIVGVVTFFAVSRIAFASPGDREAVSAGSIALIIVSALIGAAISVLGSALLQALLVIEVSREILGEKRTFGFLWKAAWRRFGPLLGFLLLVMLLFIVVIGLFVGIIIAATVTGGAAGAVISIIVSVILGLGLVVLAVWVGTKLALVPCAIVLERASLRDALARSWRLTDGSFWKIFGVLALISIIISVASQVVTTPLSFVAPLGLSFVDPNQSSTSTTTGMVVLLIVVYALSLIIAVVFGAISSVVQAGAVVLLYVDQRMRKEGLDLELIRYVEAGGTASDLPDPFDPVRGR